MGPQPTVSTLGCASELPVSAAHNQHSSLLKYLLPECVNGFKIGTLPGLDCPVCIAEQALRCGAVHPHICAAQPACTLGEKSVAYRPGCCSCRPPGCHAHPCDQHEDCGEGRGPLLTANACCATYVSVDAACPRCDDMVCSTGYAATPLADGCCECRPTFKHCNDSSLIRELVELAADLTNARACTENKQCIRQNIETAYGSAFNQRAATDVAQGVQEAAEPTCNICSFMDFCNHPGVGATCVDGQCIP